MDTAPPPGYRRRRSVVAPLILIGLGAIFLLQNFGVLSWQFWGSVWQYWPVILILVGLELVLGGRGAVWLILFVILVALIGVIASGVAGRVSVPAGPFGNFRPSTGNAQPAISNTSTQDLLGAKQATVTLQFGAGDMTVGPLAGGGNILSQVSYSGPESLQPRPSFKQTPDGHASLTYKSGGGEHQGGFPFFNGSPSSQAGFLLNPDIPLNLTVQEGASTSHLDLSQLKVTNLTLDTGASTTTVDMPATAGSTTAQIRGGASTINVNIPDGVAAHITYQGGLSTLNIDQSRFTQTSAKVYETPGYATAQNKLDLTLQAGVATINVK
jgi:hypothetical protein